RRERFAVRSATVHTNTTSTEVGWGRRHPLCLGRPTAGGPRHDHAPAQWAHGLVGHEDAPVLSEGSELLISRQDAPPAIVVTVPHAAAPYRASGLVLWPILLQKSEMR